MLSWVAGRPTPLPHQRHRRRDDAPAGGPAAAMHTVGRHPPRAGGAPQDTHVPVLQVLMGLTLHCLVDREGGRGWADTKPPRHHPSAPRTHPYQPPPDLVRASAPSELEALMPSSYPIARFRRCALELGWGCTFGAPLASGLCVLQPRLQLQQQGG
jgi:hypothetical protein